MTEQPGFDVFVSYSTPDRAHAEITCEALEDAGFRCWIAPRNIVPGTSWGAAISQAISSSRLLLLIFSGCTNESQQVEREVQLAADEKIPLMAFRVENVRPSHGLRYFLSANQWLDAWDPPIEPHLDRLVQAVAALISRDPPSTFSPTSDRKSGTFPSPGSSSRGAGRATSFVSRERKAIQDVDAALERVRRMPGPVSLDAACAVTGAAIQHGAGIYNDGSHDGCARIYLHAARGLLALFKERDTVPDDPLKDASFAREEFARIDARYPSITPANANEAAWALRHAFDRLPLRAIVLHGIEEVSKTVETLRQTGKPLSLTDAARVILLSIAHGNVLYQEQALGSCAELHLHTAKRLLSLPEGEDAGSAVIQRVLGPFVSVQNIDEDEDLAWRLYRAFLELLSAAGVKGADSAAPV